MQVGITIGSVIVGGLVTFFCSKHYYEKASKELRIEAEKLCRLNNLILRVMENAGLATLTRDAQGNITNFVVNVNASGAVSFLGSTSPVLTQTVKEKQEKGGGDLNEIIIG